MLTHMQVAWDETDEVEQLSHIHKLGVMAGGGIFIFDPSVAKSARKKATRGIVPGVCAMKRFPLFTCHLYNWCCVLS